jgi:hypothetical protein
MSRHLNVCYVLVCEGWDRHAQMMWLSATSLKLHEPEASITLVTDPLTRQTLEQSAGQLLRLVDRVVVVESDIADPRLRAFYLKTALRRHVEGDFLYLDGDTLVVKPIGDVLDTRGDVAAALDFNHDGPWFPPQLRQPYETLGWPYPLEFYFNSGVMLMRDVPEVRSFSEEWTRRWHLLVDQGMPGDQEAFVTALYASPVRWCRLPATFNSITVKRNYRFRDARILHFFGSADEQRGTIFAHLLETLRHSGTFDMAAYRRSLREQHQWGPGYQPWQLWRSRNYVRAVLLKTRLTIADAFGLSAERN